MAAYVEIANASRAGRAVWINPRHVVCVREAEDTSRCVVTLADGTDVLVAEPLVEVVRLLGGAGA